MAAGVFLVYIGLTWALPIYISLRIGRGKNRMGWLYGLLLGWIGVLIVWMRSPLPGPTAVAVVTAPASIAPASPPVEQPPPGWYADPYDAANLRYWDGSHWTGNVAPAGTAAAAPG